MKFQSAERSGVPGLLIHREKSQTSLIRIRAVKNMLPTEMSVVEQMETRSWWRPWMKSYRITVFITMKGTWQRTMVHWIWEAKLCFVIPCWIPVDWDFLLESAVFIILNIVWPCKKKKKKKNVMKLLSGMLLCWLVKSHLSCLFQCPFCGLVPPLHFTFAPAPQTPRVCHWLSGNEKQYLFVSTSPDVIADQMAWPSVPRNNGWIKNVIEKSKSNRIVDLENPGTPYLKITNVNIREKKKNQPASSSGNYDRIYNA